VLTGIARQHAPGYWANGHRPQVARPGRGAVKSRCAIASCLVSPGRLSHRSFSHILACLSSAPQLLLAGGRAFIILLGAVASAYGMGWLLKLPVPRPPRRDHEVGSRTPGLGLVILFTFFRSRRHVLITAFWGVLASGSGPSTLSPNLGGTDIDKRI